MCRDDSVQEMRIYNEQCCHMNDARRSHGNGYRGSRGDVLALCGEDIHDS